MRATIGLAIWTALFAAPTFYMFQRWEVTRSYLDLTVSGLFLLLCVRYVASAFRIVGSRVLVAVAVSSAPYVLISRILLRTLGSPEHAPHTLVIWALLGTILLHAVFEAPKPPSRRELVPGETPENSLRRVLPNARGRRIALLRDAQVPQGSPKTGHRGSLQNRPTISRDPGR